MRSNTELLGLSINTAIVYFFGTLNGKSFLESLAYGIFWFIIYFPTILILEKICPTK